VLGGDLPAEGLGPGLVNKRFVPPLKAALRLIEENDTNYELREAFVHEAMWLARACGLQTGYRIDPSEPEWTVAMIELPTGQVSWHMPQHPVAYDGHTTEEKYRRIREWTEE